MSAEKWYCSKCYRPAASPSEVEGNARPFRPPLIDERYEEARAVVIRVLSAGVALGEMTAPTDAMMEESLNAEDAAMELFAALRSENERLSDDRNTMLSKYDDLLLDHASLRSRCERLEAIIAAYKDFVAPIRGEHSRTHTSLGRCRTCERLAALPSTQETDK